MLKDLPLFLILGVILAFFGLSAVVVARGPQWEGPWCPNVRSFTGHIYVVEKDPGGWISAWNWHRGDEKEKEK